MPPARCSAKESVQDLQAYAAKRRAQLREGEQRHWYDAGYRHGREDALRETGDGDAANEARSDKDLEFLSKSLAESGIKLSVRELRKVSEAQKRAMVKVARNLEVKTAVPVRGDVEDEELSRQLREHGIDIDTETLERVRKALHTSRIGGNSETQKRK